MVKEEIVEGIRVAVKKGETLRDAMMSFYNGGYNKEDIEEAAREVYSKGMFTEDYKSKKEIQENRAEQEERREYEKDTPTAPKTTQKISDYSTEVKEKKSFAKKMLLILLFLFLLLIGGAILALILFKKEILSAISGV